MPFWTKNPDTGIENQSPRFLHLVEAVQNCLTREGPDAFTAVPTTPPANARLIVAQLAHVYGMRPEGDHLVEHPEFTDEDMVFITNAVGEQAERTERYDLYMRLERWLHATQDVCPHVELRDGVCIRCGIC